MTNTFAERFKELRLESKLTQGKIAAIFNVTQSTIAKWEHGDIEPSFNELMTICQFFHESSDFLLGIEI